MSVRCTGGRSVTVSSSTGREQANGGVWAAAGVVGSRWVKKRRREMVGSDGRVRVLWWPWHELACSGRGDHVWARHVLVLVVH